MSEDVEDVWDIVHERDVLRARVKRLETENAKLRTIIASYADKVPVKPADAGGGQRNQRQRQSSQV